MSDIFPLRDGYFKPLVYTPQERAQWKQQVVDLVARSLVEERPLLASQYERVDLNVWKLIKTKNQLRVYRPRSGSDTSNNWPCVLAVGTIEGTLEDVVYGIHNTSTRDIRVTRAFLSDAALDSAVLHVFENGTDADPFRSFALKWRAVQTPVGGLVKNRDGCVLEYMGIDVDEHGHRYAFQVSENFTHAVCPPFTARGVVRADVHIRAIYRELGGGRVGVYFRGAYDMSGHLPTILASWTAAAVALAVGKSVECAEAKKLTALALTQDNIATRRTRASSRSRTSAAACSICDASPTYLSGLSAMSECQICSSSVCHKCCSRKFLLSDATKIKVQCCKQCIVDAKRLDVDARVPLQLVSSTYWIGHGLLTDGHHHEPRTPPRLMHCSRRKHGASSESETTRHTDSDCVASSRTVSPVRTHVYLNNNDAADREREPIKPILCGTSSPTPISSPNNTPPTTNPSALWMRMQQLQLVAENTYRMLTESNKRMGIEQN